LSQFTPTKKAVKQLVNNFIETKNRIFSDVNRGTNAVENKVSDVVYEEVIKTKPRNESEMKAAVDELMRGAIELADKLNFVKIIYDFVLISANNY